MSKLTFNKFEMLKFCRIADQVVVGDKFHRVLLSELTGNTRFNSDQVTADDLLPVLKEYGGDVDMGVLFLFPGNKVRIEQDSSQFMYPPTDISVRGPLRQKTSEILAGIYPDYNFVVRNK